MNLQELSSIQDFLTQAQQGVQTAAIHVDIFQKEWDFLVASETKLIDLMNDNEQPPGGLGDAEYGLILYWLNQSSGPFKPLLDFLGMPQSQVTPAIYQGWVAQLETGPGVVMLDGTLISTVKYAGADLVWAEAFLFYLRSRYAKYLPLWVGLPVHQFVNTPKQTNLTGSVTIAIMGDWGTGVWPDGNSSLCPAELVSDAIMGLTPKPDIVIHLGDVYYYGSDGQEKSALNLWPGTAGASFTLNSNHEMYDGVNGYYGTALTNNAFTAQNGSSFFAITTDNWIIFGLDSAYYDQSTLYSNGALTDPGQLGFITQVLAQPGNAAKQIIVMTHHNAVSYDGTQLNTYNDGANSLASDVYKALGNRMPDYWYYGHLHNGIVYDGATIGSSGVFNPIANGLTSNLRCMGHGAIPFGNAYGLKDSTLVNYFTQTLMPNPNARQTSRVLNGFMTITLNGSAITEQVYEVENAADNGGGYIANAVWPTPPASIS
jgi:3',5'-cyclic AMP phosphodiesterase CpdA